MIVRYLFLLICFINIQNSSQAIEYKKHTITFGKDDFSFTNNKKGQLVINCSKLAVEYDNDVSIPGLPKFFVKLAVPRDMKYMNVDVVSDKTLLMQDVDIAPNPELKTTDDVVYVVPDEKKEQDKYSNGIYPSNGVEYICSTKIGDYTILNFEVCPMEYDAETRRLFLLNSISLNIQLQEEHDNSKRLEVVGNGFVRAIVDNPEDVCLSLSPTNSINRNNTDVDYLIISRDSLVDSFMPLVNWKKKKGVRAKIVTMEHIINHYSGDDDTKKIKECILQYKTDYNLKYVLLGGDDNLVSIKKIPVSAGSQRTSMPSDLYYACLNGDLEWNQNGNQTLGELADSIDFEPSIYLTRVPIRTSSDVNAFVNKLLRYEITPTINGWSNNLLMCGAKLDPNTSAEIQSDSLYNQYIRDIWDGSRTKFFDNQLVFDSGQTSARTINADNLQLQLEQGYAFIDVNTHGEPTYWEVKGYNSEYDCSYAASLQSSQPSIIITSACLTNAFDNLYNPCLSEAFIRNPKNSVIAYLGCSREGWYRGNNVSCSMMYNAMFYKHLFSTEHPNKSYGAIVARAKMELVSYCNADNEYRWIQLGLNPIGDPEMPVFYNTPIEFTTVSYTETGENRISVSAGGVSNCRICVMSSEDWGETYYQIVDSTTYAEFTDLPDNYSICITRQGYIPYVLEHRNYIQNETICGSMNIISSSLNVGKSVTTEKPIGEVVFDGGIINIKGNHIKFESGTTVKLGTTLNINSQ